MQTGRVVYPAGDAALVKQAMPALGNRAMVQAATTLV